MAGLFIYTQRRRVFAGRRLHVASWSYSSGLRGYRWTYLTILKSAEHALFKMVRYGQDVNWRLPAKTRLRRLDEQANIVFELKASCLPE
jgi:hypothetical protein